VRTLLEMAQPGTAIQIWIEGRLCDIGSDHETRVASNAEYDGLGALVPEKGYQFRTTPTGSGSFAVVALAAHWPSV